MVINVVDATNIERNLYLTVQLLEMGVKVVIALNMMDEAEDKGIKIDTKALSQKLQVPIISTVASKNKGIDALIKQAIDVIKSEEAKSKKIPYGHEIDKEIEKLKHLLNQSNLNVSILQIGLL